MSFIQFEYEPSKEIMHELREQLSIIGSTIISSSKILDVCGVGKMVSEERVDTYQSIIDSMDNLLLNHCKEFAKWMIENKLVDSPDRIYKPNLVQCDHNWSEVDMFNHECTQCNRRIKSLPCEYCGHDDAIRCHDDFVCTKCNISKCMRAQPPEFRSYRDAQDAIRDGTADQSDPIIKYTQKCLDLQAAYCKNEYQKILDEQNEALLKHINNKKDAKIKDSIKVIKHEDGTEWLEGVNTSDQPIQVTISRSVEKAYNMETGKTTTTPTGPWKVAKIQHEQE